MSGRKKSGVRFYLDGLCVLAICGGGKEKESRNVNLICLRKEVKTAAVSRKSASVSSSRKEKKRKRVRRTFAVRTGKDREDLLAPSFQRQKKGLAGSGFERGGRGRRGKRQQSPSPTQ